MTQFQPIHGHCTNGITKEYRAYHHLLRRCTDDKVVGYHSYGGRGIECRYKDFPAFLDDVGLAPTPQHQIDRIDNNGHYEAGNCRWVTRKDNCRNRRSSKYITYQGETKSMAEWAEVTGISQATLHYRLTVKGWPPERAFGQPVRQEPQIEYNGQTVNLTQLASLVGIHNQTLIHRYRRGLRGDDLTRPPQKGGERD